MIGRPALGRGVKQTAQVTTIPAPMKGMESRTPMSDLSPANCVYTYNIMPAEFGMTVRSGYRDFAVNIKTAPTPEGGVKSVIPFKGSAAGADDDRLFAATQEGIYDITDETIAPIEAFPFTVTTEEAGNTVFCNYIDDGGEEYILLADEANGLIVYTKSSDDWTVPTGITDMDIDSVAFVVVHKQRIWFVKKDSTTAWYLPVASIAGAATEFHFGSKFPHGGRLKGLYNWSVDGGAGVDDHLIAISSAGDVIPYKGEDPSSAATWTIVGTYYIGEVPLGRNIASEYGGDLHLLSVFGVVSMSSLLNGSSGEAIMDSGVGSPVAKLMHDAIHRRLDDRGIFIEHLPSLGALLINIPTKGSLSGVAYVMNISTKGWGLWRGIDATCFAEHNGTVYFGRDRDVKKMTGNLDDVKKINPPSFIFDSGRAIEFSILTGFRRMGSDGLFKQCQMIRPDFYCEWAPEYEAKAVYDFNVAELAMPSGRIRAEIGRWDSSKWDTAVWGGGSETGHSSLHGTGGGIGRNMAIAIRGTSYSETTLMSIDEIWTTGGAI